MQVIEQVLSFLSTPAILAVLLLANVLLFVLCISLSVRINQTRKSLRRLFTGTDGANLEVGMHRLLDELGESKKKQADQQFVINRLSQKLASQCGQVAVVRYNAFGDIGSDLSFSLALLDDALNGVVITSIYGREESRIYAKPIESGMSVYNLSEEEQTVIKKASNRIE